MLSFVFSAIKPDIVEKYVFLEVSLLIVDTVIFMSSILSLADRKYWLNDREFGISGPSKT